MTKHFVKIVHSLAIPAGGWTLCDLLIEPVWRGARRCKLRHSDGSLFAYIAFLCITVTVSLVIRMSLRGSSEIQLPFYVTVTKSLMTCVQCFMHYYDFIQNPSGELFLCQWAH